MIQASIVIYGVVSDKVAQALFGDFEMSQNVADYRGVVDSSMAAKLFR